MALLDFFLSRKKNTANIAKNGCRLLLLNAVAAMQNRIICRSCVKIFLRSFVNTYKLILRW